MILNRFFKYIALVIRDEYASIRRFIILLIMHIMATRN